MIDVEPDDVPDAIEDGETIDPHSMDPMTMLRFVRVIGGWPGRVQVIACEPAEVEDVGVGLNPAVEAAVARAIVLVLETIEELRSDAPTRRRDARALDHQRDRRHGRAPRRGRPVTAVHVRLGRLRQVVPSSLAFYFELVSRETVCEGARLEQEVVPAALAATSALTAGRSTRRSSAARGAGRRA